ncbi:2-keto-4-pentenoate hydratase/2-oxohepta-3-ene-1,7-dioic acid hydratase in catechol pathway [Propionibacteriaceae bacterium ES.041]|uniref:fumarylacetoacetate hydrolase family protein n=1 Tax=Enemella evansiae TaxID=2016499 RepID=UPI000B95EE09|nr:fumarylacetoacetate hydrolase family protein [Enemella evansiae]OYO02938.1 fumarylacetoacetate hydrolase [Enemella evansiae]PFG69320.1 2-keto-4-pentenoate hydratase/2-oxohepta-3-ene-1,7-dioic acid hydratase in catechol pathway [Propionibacteriaceae bacterium ES.041]
MKLTGFVQDGVRHIGAIEGDGVRDLGSAADFYRDTKAALAGSGGDVRPLAGLELTPAVPETARIFCVGINYRSHADESKDLAGLDEPKVPMIFGRWQQSLTVDGVGVPVPPNEPGLDWEVELAAVIGDEVWQADEQNADDHVLGYAAFNDLSARTKQLETPQFTVGKNADLSGPISPVVTADDVPNPGELEVTTRVNGEVMQKGNTRDLIHSVSRIIAYITDTITLLPGDVIATGTPGGIGAGRKPPVFLHPGDEVTVEVESVGTVSNPIIARS